MKLSIDALAASRTASAAKTLLPQQAKAAPVDPDEKVLIDPKAWRPQTALPGMQPADVSAAAGSNGAARAGDTREVASDSADSSSNESAASTPRRKSAGYVPVLLVGGLVASCLGLGAFILMRRPSSVPESRAAVATGGSLTIGKAPSPDVMLFVDDVGVGNPPKTVPVSPGGHRVLLVNRKSGESKKVEINVDPGGSSYVPVE